MNRYKTLILVTAISLMGGCAELEPVDTMALTDITFHNWIAKNAPDATLFVNDKGVTEKGIYIKYHHKAPQSHDSLKVLNLKWLRYNLNAFNLNHKTISISDSTLSHQAGMWKNTTHWVPNYRQFDSINSSFLCPGLIKVFPTLNIGDNVRIYLSSKESFVVTPNVSVGNAGAFNEFMNFPTYMDLQLVDVNNNAYTNLIDSMNYFALHKWGMQPDDTIGVEGVFMKKIIPNPTGDPIAKDTVFSMNVTRFFLDDFMVSTTSDSIAKIYDRYDAKDTNIKYGKFRSTVQSSVNDPNLSKIYSIAPLLMKKGETALFLINPYYTTEGYQGNTSLKPAILPYEPTYYKIAIDTVTIKASDTDDPIV